MTNKSDQASSELPHSLGEHVIPGERAEMIRSHIQSLSETALEVSDTLPFSADTSDFLQVLNAMAEDD
ncbi:MAG: hypothetical protein CBC34_008060 [Hyphomicrobiaceae bacterium TMED74]|nr:hypothetical protein [Filomicrobium sp.]RPG42309.1 MAG: hypothetical protein CBC34_008060 [Hyphomicrobiaceae bacterium TMED74]